MRRRSFVLVAAGLFGAGLFAAGPAPAAPPRGATLRVLAAASLVDAFGDVSHRFEAAHPGVHVQLALAGSQQLVAQLEQGAPGDVFASADTHWMDEARTHGLTAGDPQVFAHNRLVIILPRTNPGRIGGLGDLARRGVKLVIGADAVPAGRYARQLFDNLSRRPRFPRDYARRVLANVVSEEENVKSVAGKVQLGEADAGVVYQSDVTPALARYVRVIPPPDDANVVATYPIAALATSRQPELARAFVAAVLSAEGQQALERHGLMRASAAP